MEKLLAGRVVTIVLPQGAEVNRDLASRARELGIRRGQVIAGLGSLRQVTVRNPVTADMPPRMERRSWDGPLEVVSLEGEVNFDDAAKGPVHLHGSFSLKDGQVVGGALDSPSRVFKDLRCMILVEAEWDHSQR